MANQDENEVVKNELEDIQTEEISEETAVDPVAEEPADPLVKHDGTFYGTGRRKRSIARVWITAGSGTFIVDGRELKDYFDNRARWIFEALEPLECLGFEEKIDVKANLKGGGKTGQAGAFKLGLARALVEMDPNARPPLHSAGQLTRDDRKVERKKINQPGARAKAQVSKR